MLGSAETVGQIESWLTRPATKPGHGDPEPLKPVRTHDTPENVAICLDCPVPGRCRMELSACPLRGKARSEKIAERDSKVRDLLNAGWVNRDAICEELGISKNVFYSTLRRLRERGEVN